MHSGLGLNDVVRKLAIRPREILGLPAIRIKEKEKANLTLFLPGKEWKLEEKAILSKSKNSPFVGKKLKGKIAGIVNGGKVLTF